MKCSKCGNEIPEGAKFCGKCGAPVEEVSDQEKQEIQQDTEQNTEQMPESEPQKYSFNASSSTGESALGSLGTKALNSATGLIPGPGKVIAGSVKAFFSSVKAAFKDPKKLIPAIVLAVIWLVLNILQACGINPIPTQILSFLTFANGGMSGGFLGAVGGIIGKGLFAGAIGSIVSLIINKSKSGKTSKGGGLKGALGFTGDALGAYITGAGLAVFLFLFISGGATRMAFMGGMAASYLAGRSVLTNGFLTRLLTSITSKGKTKASPIPTGIVKGLCAGFALSSLLGLINVWLVHIILGSVLLVGGIVLIILQKTGVLKIGKEADAK
ncbi:MAG: zinc-ribbon domain-containing protein [Clostridiales bacterium]|nr:zinc-ribbon domain-containing protein [Clostridiales bacterium]